MPKLNRNSIADAEQLIKEFLPDASVRQLYINFLVEAISYADAVSPGNWTLNLEPNGRFLRFNTGLVYCIQLAYDELLVLCNRSVLTQTSVIADAPLLYLGKTASANFAQLPSMDTLHDLLESQPNSIGVILTEKTIIQYLPLLKQANHSFITDAVVSPASPVMKAAHSKGAVDYVFSAYNELSKQELPDIHDILQQEAQQLKKAFTLSSEQRKQQIAKANVKPDRVVVQQTVFIRNQYVVAEVLFRANGYCEGCKKPAPFVRSSDNSPYLEVHHKTPLAQGGDDTVENALALCPNCHRKAHYGKE